ncbi:hypothetical protein QO034_13925 [Sedimentitalea sp. JM2-8]|uniref:Uncharacterized protein n=1 Tax=Sedimentitalea xiamensis TaxID=3050037 RepID=A0ABT7FGG7_9RHOB|nr:hypothetical protein [Sedimentitalea xiamensis]MDK3074212.1 hypothetical protein [Sedimentitalea xiamensis]
MPRDVHPQIRAIPDRTADPGIPRLQSLTTGQARALMERMAKTRAEAFPPPGLLSVENGFTGAGYNHLPVRIYRPSDTDAAFLKRTWGH